MNTIDKITTKLTEEFDAFVLLGCIYNPVTDETETRMIRRGNVYACEGMLRDQVEVVAEIEEDG